jgi:hypothetical protein
MEQPLIGTSPSWIIEQNNSPQPSFQAPNFCLVFDLRDDVVAVQAWLQKRMSVYIIESFWQHTKAQ